MRMLLTDEQDVNLEFIRYLLKTFVNTAKELYGKSFTSYNIHSLIHLPDNYQCFGNLDNVSAFKFE